MIRPNSSQAPESSKGSGLRPLHAVVVLGSVVVAAVIAFALLSAIVGTLAFIVKFVAVVVVFALVVRFMGHRART